MAEWGPFCAAFLAFFVAHAAPVQPPVKAFFVKRLGQPAFTLLYSGMSLALVAWLIFETDKAPYILLWPSASWQPYVPLVAMLLACLLVALAIARPNPFSFGGARNDTFDPARPGMVRLTRHPFLAALALWAFAHIPPNGDLAHLILFGSFGGFAVLGDFMIDRRKRRQIANWDQSVADIRKAPILVRPKTGAVFRLILGAIVYGVLLWLHPLVLGVSPLPQ